MLVIGSNYTFNVIERKGTELRKGEERGDRDKAIYRDILLGEESTNNGKPRIGQNGDECVSD